MNVPYKDSKMQSGKTMTSVNQDGPRHTEDSGPGECGAGTPTPEDRGAVVASNFPVKKWAGDGSTTVKGSCTVNLETGAHS